MNINEIIRSKKPEWKLEFKNALKEGELVTLRQTMEDNLRHLSNLLEVDVQGVDLEDLALKYVIKENKCDYLIRKIDSFRPRRETMLEKIFSKIQAIVS